MNAIQRLKFLSSAAGLMLIASLASAQTAPVNPEAVSIAGLAGNWQMTLTGMTGCGPSSLLVNVTLDSTGVGTNAVLKVHGQCGDTTIQNQTFQIQSLSANGSGKANLSCGTGCGWNLDIQVPKSRQTFNMVDVDPINPGNYIGGTAMRQQ